MKRHLLPVIGVAALLCTLLAANILAENFSIARQPVPYQPPDQPTSSATATYTGTLRTYLVKPVYNYNDNSGHPYEFGLIKFPQIVNLTIPDGGRQYSEVTTYSAATYDTNVALIAVVFNSAGYTQNACPGYGTCNFTAHYNDAAAMAYPGLPAIQPTDPDQTHCVFIEEGTATW